MSNKNVITLFTNLLQNSVLPLVLVLLFTGMCVQNAVSGTVYKWVDEEGNVNFSDAPPDGSAAEDTQEISITTSDVNPDDVERFSIINQVETMTEWRRELKEERLAERRLNLEEKRLAHELELDRELSRRNDAIAADDYRSRNYYYPSSPIFRGNRRHHNQHDFFDGHPSQFQQPVIPPSRRNIIPRKYGPVHL